MNISNVFLNCKGDRIISQNSLFSISKSIHSKIGNQELWFLHYACLLIWVVICMKAYEDILSGFKLYNRHD